MKPDLAGLIIWMSSLQKGDPRLQKVDEIRRGVDRLPSEQPMQQDYLTTLESCSFLRCSRMSLYRAETDGLIQSVRFRGKKLFERAELIKALKRGKGRK